MRLTRAVLASALACGACSARPPPPQVVEPETASDAGVEALGPLVWVGLVDDRVQVDDGPVHPDGRKDYAFVVRVGGPVVSFTLTLSDMRGRRIFGSIWDTITGSTPIAKELDVPMDIGAHTAQLAVYDAQGRLVDPSGSLPPGTVFDGSLVTIVAPDWGSEFRDTGRSFTLLVLRPSGRIERTTAVIL